MIGFLAFSIRRAFQGLWRNRVMSLAAMVTMVLMLLMLAGLVIVLSGMEAGLSYVESKVEIRAELYDGADPSRVATLEAQVAALPEVASVTFISKDQALADLRAQEAAAGQPDLSTVVGSNPLPDQLAIKLKDPKDFGSVKATLLAPDGVVARIPDQATNVDQLISITALLRTVGLIIVVLVGMTVLLIVVNTIRMALMSRADEIEIMRLVGASDSFVRWPFIFEGLLVGLFGALLTLGLLSLASGPISQLANAIAGQVPVGFGQQLTSEIAAVVFGAGLGLGGIGAWISVRAYLRN